MAKYITINNEFEVLEVVEAIIATGFLPAPRDDIKVGDILSEYEKMLLGLIPFDASLVPADPVIEPVAEPAADPIAP